MAEHTVQECFTDLLRKRAYSVAIAALVVVLAGAVALTSFLSVSGVYVGEPLGIVTLGIGFVVVLHRARSEAAKQVRERCEVVELFAPIADGIPSSVGAADEASQVERRMA